MSEPWDPVPGDPGELSSQGYDYWDDFQVEEENPLSEAMRQVGLEFLEGFKQGVENAQLKFEEATDDIHGARSYGSIFDEAVDWSDVKNPKLSDKDKDLRRKKVLKKETNRRANKLARTNRKKNRKK